MDTRSTLEARLQDLERENAELSLAASEAASLAEEYAADAAAYRRMLAASSTSDALVTELSDATRRKDRRINRLTSLLESEKETVETLQKEVVELTELKEVADEMEDTLRKSIAALQRKIVEGDRRAVSAVNGDSTQMIGAQLRIAEAVHDTLIRYLPSSVDVTHDVAAFSALRAGVAVLHLAFSLRDLLSSHEYGVHGDVFEELTSAICASVDTALRWCFAEEAQIPVRGPAVEPELRALRDRTRALCHDMASPLDVSEWTEDFTNMKVELVSMTVERLDTLVAREFPRSSGLHDITDVDLLLEQVMEQARKRANVVASGLRNCDEADGKKSGDIAELRKLLDAARATVHRKDRDIEDLKVRNAIFEEKVTLALDEAKEVVRLRKRATELEKELTRAKEHAVLERQEEAARETNEETQELKPGDTDNSSGTSRHLDAIDDARQSSRLRRILIHRQLADLQCVAQSTNYSPERLRSQTAQMQVLETIREALDNAREAASNARVVHLDARTLQPKTRGATMSRKQMLQARTLADKHLPKGDAPRGSPDRARSLELKVNNGNMDVHAVTDALRLSLCP